MNNTEKALDLLGLPVELAFADGPIKTMKRLSIVEEVVQDFTKPGRPTTKTYSVQEKTQLFGHYGLNLMNSYLLWMGFDGGMIGQDFVASKDHVVRTITVGPFAGKEYWYPWQRVVVSKTASGAEIRLTWEQGMNTTPTGDPEPTGGSNPLMSITQKTYIITSTGKRLVSTKAVNVRVNDLSANSGWSKEAISEANAQIFYVSTPSTNEISSVACHVGITGDQLEMKYFVNGLHARSEINPSGMITSYGKQWPGVKLSYRLSDGFVGTTLGYSAEKYYTSIDDNTVVTLAEGATGISDNVITWNPEGGGTLVAWTEEYPATGKGFAVSSWIDLQTLVQTPA